MVGNLWNPLSPMHYGAAVNLSKDVIYHFMEQDISTRKNRPWFEVVPCTLARRIEGLNLLVMLDGFHNMSRTQVSAGCSR